MQVYIKHSVLYVIGGISYVFIELLWRGYSHITMLMLGGLCFVAIGYINKFLSWDTPLWQQCVIASTIVTISEFVAGLILNVWLGLHIWDYSNLPFNLLGQICLPFMAAWLILSVPAIILDDYLRYWLFGEEKPRYKLF